MENRDDAFLHILYAFAKALKIEVSLDIAYSQKQILFDDIKLKDESLFKLLYDLSNIKDAYQFIRFDKDLILKAHDIWKSESKKMGEELNRQLDLINSKAKELNIAIDNFIKVLRVK